ncbi:hypothetical protein J6590_006539 [Homalodisca vitripennis]|nr:hypothetical protein J6590_006539 [Homalodisca vitripennis]
MSRGTRQCQVPLVRLTFAPAMNKTTSDGSVDFIQRVVDDSSSDNSSACSESDDEATVTEVPTWEYYNNRYEAY